MDELTTLTPCGHRCFIEAGWRLLAEPGCPQHDAPDVVWAAPLPTMRATLSTVVFLSGAVIVVGMAWN